MWMQVIATVIATLIAIRVYNYGARVTRPRRLAARQKRPIAPQRTELHIRITIRRNYK